MLDPVLLQTFLAVAQTYSFSQAAERLGLRQSTVSQHIRKLEEEAGPLEISAVKLEGCTVSVHVEGFQIELTCWSA
jgi:predicted transcriptional regulator